MQMIIASRLTDGRVVFLSKGAGWVDEIVDGALLDSQEEAERRLAETDDDVANNVIVDPYLIDVVVEGGNPRPAHVREAIRAFGPTVRTDAEAA